MKIIEALKNPDETLRLDNGAKWLVWNENSNEWEVYRHKTYARKTERVAHTVNEDEAVAALLYANEVPHQTRAQHINEVNALRSQNKLK